MTTQRKLDEMHILAEERTRRIREEFLRNLMGNRAQPMQAPAAPTNTVGPTGHAPMPIPEQPSGTMSQNEQYRGEGG